MKRTAADAKRTGQDALRNRRPKLLLFVSEDWYFWSHRLPLAMAARDAGFEVTVMTRLSSHEAAMRGHGLNVEAIRMSRRTVSLRSELRSLGEIVAVYRRLRPDLVHHVAVKPVVFGSIAARIAGIRGVVNALAGLGWVFSDAKNSTGGLRTLVSVAFRVLLRRGQVIVQNPDDRQALLRFGIDRAAISVIKGAGVALDRFVPSAEPGGEPLILLASRMLWSKGVKEFVEAAGQLRARNTAARFALVGVPDEQNPDAVPITTLEDWNDSGVVEWWGRRNDMPEILAQAHVVCLPSFYREGVPKVLIEAAACGRAIVTTATPGCREIVRQGENGLLVPPRDAGALADAIGWLISHPHERRQMGVRGRTIAETEFSVESVNRATLAVYQQALSA
jgi:glycosyltransferase involved in cell wall biosynthesis